MEIQKAVDFDRCFPGLQFTSAGPFKRSGFLSRTFSVQGRELATGRWNRAGQRWGMALLFWLDFKTLLVQPFGLVVVLHYLGWVTA